jgi:hypothetical protein
VDILFEYNPVWILGCILLGLVYTAILYWRQKRIQDLSKGFLIALGTLRAVTVATIAFLLLGPFFRYFERQVQRPVVIIAQDNSASVLQSADSVYYKTEFQEKMNQLKEDLSSEYDVETYVFDKDIKPSDSRPDFAGKQTDLSNGLRSLYERNLNRNIGAIILSSDGIYNRGASPVHQVASMGIPVFTIAQGDTTKRRDLILEDAAYNRLAYLGNEFPIEVTVKAYGLQGKASTLTVKKGGETLSSRRVDINETDFLITVPLLFKASSVGRQYFDLNLTALDGELTKVNNYMRIFIDVLDSRQRILVLHEAPHPDIAALKEAIISNENYEVIVANASAFNADFKDFNLVILHGGPGSKAGTTGAIEKAKAEKIPLWLIQTLRTDILAMSRAELGVTFSVRGGNNTTDATAKASKGFSLFQWSEDAKTLISELPPIQSLFGQAELQNGSQSAINQRIGIVDTNQPLWAFKEVNGFKSSVLVGEGLWRWRMADFMSKGNHERFNELITKAVQYMSAKEDKRFFRVYAKTTFDEDEDILIDAELYDASYELTNEPEVNVKLKDQGDNVYDFAFNRSGKSYRLNAGRLPAGTYTYDASTEFAGSAIRASGSFDIQEIRIEERNTSADHQLLFKLAISSGGKMYLARDFGTIQEDLKSDNDIVPMIYSTEQVKELIESKWIFFLLLLLLSIEWFVRKYRGAY